MKHFIRQFSSLKKAPLNIIRNIKFIIIALIINIAGLISCSVATSNVTVSLLDSNAETVATGFNTPWAIAVIGEEEFLITDRIGDLYYFKDGALDLVNGLPIIKQANGTPPARVVAGLMDVSLHPDFETNGLTYLTYINDAEKLEIGRFDFRSRKVENFEVVYEFDAFSIGSRIAWEDQNHFFVVHGFGGPTEYGTEAQDIDIDAGKVHRFMSDGSIPADNPIFDGMSEPSSIWSFGHRVPQGMVYDNGVLYLHEHGPAGGDEFNVIEKGGNYGWPLFTYGEKFGGSTISKFSEEEASEFSILPVKHWGDWTLAPSGLVRLENSSFPEWNGTFLLGALVPKQLIAYDIDTGQTFILLEDIGRIRDVAQLPSGDILILIDATDLVDLNGQVIKLSPK